MLALREVSNLRLEFAIFSVGSSNILVVPDSKRICRAYLEGAGGGGIHSDNDIVRSGEHVAHQNWL